MQNSTDVHRLTEEEGEKARLREQVRTELLESLRLSEYNNKRLEYSTEFVLKYLLVIFPKGSCSFDFLLYSGVYQSTEYVQYAIRMGCKTKYQFFICVY